MTPHLHPSRREFLASAAAALAAGPGCSRSEPSAPAADSPYTVLQFGARGDGRTDDTAAIQAAIDAAAGTGEAVIVPPGTYMIDPGRHLVLPPETALRMSATTVLKAQPSSERLLSVLECRAATDVLIQGGTIDMDGWGGWTRQCQQSFGIYVSAARGITIQNVRIENAVVDGIYVTGTARLGESAYLSIEGCALRNNRRQGISVVHGRAVGIRDCVIESTRGAPPSSGIDLEPNRGKFVADVEVTGNRLALNDGYGLLLVGLHGPLEDIRVVGNRTAGNGAGGIRVLRSQRVRMSHNSLGESVVPAIVVDQGSSDVTMNQNDRPGNGAVITDAPTPEVPAQRPPSPCNPG